jgi:hypothetical protein
MSKKLKQALWEAAKEPLRLLVLAVIPVCLVALEQISAQWAAVLVLLLKLVDQILHEVGKVRKDEKLLTGLVRF